MKTRSKTRLMSAEFDRSPGRNQDDEDGNESKNLPVTNFNPVRCDECDKNVPPETGTQIGKECWLCKLCYEKSHDCNVSDLSSQSSKLKRLEGNSRSLDTRLQLHSVTGFGIVGIIIAFASIGFFSYSSLSSIFTSTGRIEIDCKNDSVLLQNFKEFKKMFPSQIDETWYTFAAGIKRIYEKHPTEPSSFLLFHEEGDETVNCLVSKISKFASNCLTGTSDTIDINSKDLRREISGDSGELITHYKDKVIEKCVMVVRNINELPGNIIKEFHYFCDTVVPLVDKAVYFFTLSTEDKIVNGNNIVYKVAHSFRNIWGSSLDNGEVLEPLRTRMSGNIIPVIREGNLPKFC